MRQHYLYLMYLVLGTVVQLKVQVCIVRAKTRASSTRTKTQQGFNIHSGTLQVVRVPIHGSTEYIQPDSTDFKCEFT